MFEPILTTWVFERLASTMRRNEFESGALPRFGLYGWPSRSLWCIYHLDHHGDGWTTNSSLGGLVLKRQGGRFFDFRAGPLRPVFPGFLINTLFYTVILWLLWSAPFATRRLIRKRRGRCPRCGYDLRHAVHDACPECGAT